MKGKRQLRRFVSSEVLPEKGQKFLLSKEESHHLRRVNRLSVGQQCLVTDGRGSQVLAQILGYNSAGNAELLVADIQSESQMNPAKLKLRVFQAIPRGVKFDFLVQKAQELEVFELFPVMTERTVVRLDAKKDVSKRERWHKIATQAAKQSGSLEIVRLGESILFDRINDLIPGKQKVILLHPDPKALTFKQWFQAEAPKLNKGEVFNLLIGPEGGFSKTELERMKAWGREKNWHFQMIHLGSSILKVDTAFIGIVSALKFMVSE